MHPLLLPCSSWQKTDQCSSGCLKSTDLHRQKSLIVWGLLLETCVLHYEHFKCVLICPVSRPGLLQVIFTRCCINFKLQLSLRHRVGVGVNSHHEPHRSSHQCLATVSCRSGYSFDSACKKIISFVLCILFDSPICRAMQESPFIASPQPVFFGNSV